MANYFLLTKPFSLRWESLKINRQRLKQVFKVVIQRPTGGPFLSRIKGKKKVESDSKRKKGREVCGLHHFTVLRKQ